MSRTRVPFPRSTAFDSAYVWRAFCFDTDRISRIDPMSCTIVRSIPAPVGDPDPNSSGLAFDGTHLWHADYGHDMIYKLDPADGTILDSFPSPATCPSGLGYFAAADVLVLADCTSDELYVIDPADGTGVATCGAANDHPWGVAVMWEWIERETVSCAPLTQGGSGPHSPRGPL